MVFHESLNQERKFSFVTPLVFIAILGGTTAVLEVATVFTPQLPYASNQALVAQAAAPKPTAGSKEANDKCPAAVAGKSAYAGMSKPKTYQEDKKTITNLSQQECKDTENKKIAVTGRCVAKGVCKGEMCDGKPCDLKPLTGSKLDPKAVEKMLGEVDSKLNDLTTKKNQAILEDRGNPLTPDEEAEVKALTQEKADYEAQIKKYGEDAALAARKDAAPETATPDNAALRNEIAVLQERKDWAGLDSKDEQRLADLKSYFDPSKLPQAQENTFGRPMSEESGSGGGPEPISAVEAESQGVNAASSEPEPVPAKDVPPDVLRRYRQIEGSLAFAKVVGDMSDEAGVPLSQRSQFALASLKTEKAALEAQYPGIANAGSATRSVSRPDQAAANWTDPNAWMDTYENSGAGLGGTPLSNDQLKQLSDINDLQSICDRGGCNSLTQAELQQMKADVNQQESKLDGSDPNPFGCTVGRPCSTYGAPNPSPRPTETPGSGPPDPSKPYYLEQVDEKGNKVWCDQNSNCKAAGTFTPPPAQGGPAKPAAAPAAKPAGSTPGGGNPGGGNPGGGSPGGGSPGGGSGGGGGMPSLPQIPSSPPSPPSTPTQTCSTDQNTYAQQQQQYQQALQQYNYQLQQYNYQKQLDQYYGGGAPVAPAPVPPSACTPSTAEQCRAQPQQPAASNCSVGTWRATYSGACIVGWQCIPSTTSAPTATISCEPKVADVGMSLAITYGCSSGTASSNSFSVSTQPGGSAATPVVAPPAGTNTATYTLACTDQGKTAGAQCSVQVARPNIILVANPKTVARNAISLLSWLTTGMKSCIISSPDQADFTARNSSNTSVNGTATTSAISSSAMFQLHCETVGGGIKDATTTIQVNN